ncbi:dihydroneopterin aldolase [Flavihumibacter stibioxidans]|uniref:dihydroneopterin aldolase n=1 Tax=Flavihumibacter stibioxidans TaxID=1834163 RepID=A0ABR7M4R1_9BACT|nr:dihydroneopterin aldolase [Flavihumibacter stibioxidans]MBC6489730.1 hypothetical protein [Flavihumibacter stibioxidans]
MLTVHLHQLIFHGFHGLYPGEEKIGNDFEVNLDITYNVKKKKLDNLKNLISYEDVFQILNHRMQVSTPLLEELADSIIRKISHQYPQVEQVRISIYKLQAPIENFRGKVGITLTRNFNS